MRTMMRKALLSTTLAALLSAPALAQDASVPRDTVFPPWQHGQNNDAIDRGFDFTVPRVDDLADFHGDPTNAKLVLYVGGNYYFAMAPLVRAFEAAHPQYRGRIYWETIPPGLLVRQMQTGGTITVAPPNTLMTLSSTWSAASSASDRSISLPPNTLITEQEAATRHRPLRSLPLKIDQIR